MDEPEPAAVDQDGPRDLSTIEGVDEMLARYVRAGEVMYAAKKFRMETRAKVLEALAGASVGQTTRWILRTERRFQREYTVNERFLNYLLIAPVEDAGGEDESVG